MFGQQQKCRLPESALNPTGTKLPIPTIIHQTWKNEIVPWRWRHLVASVKRHHPGWEYRLWTDAMMEQHVRASQPELFPVYAALEKNVMRADVFRYVAMHDFGGLYCDLDYEFVRSYPYGDTQVVLAEEFAPGQHEQEPTIANYVFASVPGHALWRDMLLELIANPPRIESLDDVTAATGPGFLTRVFHANRERYEGVMVHEKPAFSPPRIRGRNERKVLLASGRTYGMHHAWGSWKERWSSHYLGKKMTRILQRQ